MKKVTVYEVKKSDKVVYTSDEYIKIYQHSNPVSPIRGSSGEFVCKESVEVKHLPIEKYVWCQQDWKTGSVSENIVYACFDEQLLELIQCERSKFEQLNKDNLLLSTNNNTLEKNVIELNNKVYELEDKVLKLNMSLAYIKQAGFFKRIAYLFKGF